jgi:hypothetical protein
MEITKIKFVSLVDEKKKIKKIKCVTQSRTGLQIYEGHDDQLNRLGPMA